MTFLTELESGLNKSVYTENGALACASTLDAVLDYFAKGGALRSNPDAAVNLFKAAFAKNPLMAIRCLFYFRDIRGGAGERNIFRKTLDSLSKSTIKKIYKYIPEYGRWDDVPITDYTSDWLYEQLQEDEVNMAANKNVSLLAKWLPSENASSKETRRKARQLMTDWELSPREYRQRISALRKYIKLLEQNMSSNNWDGIDYSKLPSQAHRKHIKAFNRNDQVRYAQYLNSVEKGEAKINTGTLFTYEIYEQVMSAYGDTTQTKALNELWNALPDYTNGSNALVMADVSGSMNGRPMAVSVSLALYFAERNKGVFNNKFMTFSGSPKLVNVNGKTLFDKMQNIERTDWSMNTNVNAAFDAILNAAIRGKCSQEEIPAVLYIISDMQFDCCVGGGNSTNFDRAKDKFEAAGYKLPHVVFWNVWGSNGYPASMNDNRVTLISGSNQSAFRYAVENKNPLQLMEEVLNSERYAQITL